MRLLPKDKNIAWTPYFWLVYVLYIPLDAFFLKASPWQWTVTLLGMLAFLPLYFAGYWVRGRRLFWVIALITVLGVVFAPMNPAAFVYFVYAASFAAKFGNSTA